MSTKSIIIIVVVAAIVIALLAARSGRPRVTQIDRTVRRKKAEEDRDA